MPTKAHSLFNPVKFGLLWLMTLFISACSQHDPAPTSEESSIVSPSSIQVVSQPESHYVLKGSRVTLSVGAESDDELSYQWLKNASILPGATQPSYTIEYLTEAEEANYRVLIRNDQEEIYSKSATVRINTEASPITIINQPQNLSVVEGMNASFSVSASGGGFMVYQWYKNGAALENATSSTLVFENTTAHHGGNYSVSISNAQGRVDSDAATLTVLAENAPIMITQQPISNAVYLGTNAYLSVSAISYETLSYQWRFNGNNIPGETGRSLSIANMTPEQEGRYSVVISSSTATEISNDAVLEIKPDASLQLSWAIPTHRENGDPLEVTDIGGYVIEYGTSTSDLQAVFIEGAYTTHYAITGIRSPSLLLRIATVDASGTVGTFSGVLRVNIP